MITQSEFFTFKCAYTCVRKFVKRNCNCSCTAWFVYCLAPCSCAPCFVCALSLCCLLCVCCSNIIVGGKLTHFIVFECIKVYCLFGSRCVSPLVIYYSVITNINFWSEIKFYLGEIIFKFVTSRSITIRLRNSINNYLSRSIIAKVYFILPSSHHSSSQ